MKIFGIVLAAILVVAGAVINRINSTKRENREENVETQEVLSEQEEVVTPTIIATLTPSPTKVIVKGNVSDYRYPNSEILSSSENSLILKSFNEAKVVTNWYKEKIIGEGMNVKTFVETKTNDNVLNKLVGADGQKEIRVEIKKDAGTSFVQIEVSLKTTS